MERILAIPWKAMPGLIPASAWLAGERSRELTPLVASRFNGRHEAALASTHDVWEMVVVFKGHGLLHADAERPFAPGLAYLVPPGLAHRESSVGSMDVVWIGLRGSLCDALPRRVLGVDGAREPARQLWLTAQRQAMNGVQLDGLARCLLGRTDRRSEAAACASLPLDDILEYLHRHLARAIAIPVLARRFGCSERHFTRVFTRHTGLSPLRYLRRMRLESAQRLLASRTLSLAEVGRQVGYDDPAYFSRVFSQEFGRPPSAAIAAPG